MMRLLPFLLVLFPVAASAVEESFLGSTVTVVGTPLTSQPAGLAWQGPEWNLSASATSLQQTSQDVRSLSGFRPTSTPLKFVPVYIASGRGDGILGWGFNLTSVNFDFRTLAEIESGGVSSKSDFFIQTTTVRASSGVGYRFAPEWSVGASLNVLQTDIINASKTRSTYSAGKAYSNIEENSQTVYGTADVGLIYENDVWRVGATISSPSERITHHGSRETITLDTQSGQFTEKSESVSPSGVNDWSASMGVRLRLSGGGAFHLLNVYQTSGGHRPGLAFQTPSPWGTIIGSISTSTSSVRETRATVGLVRTSKTYDWGVGPHYTDSRGTTTGYVNTRTLGLGFVSEIRF